MALRSWDVHKLFRYYVHRRLVLLKGEHEFEKGKHYLLKMIIDADSHGGGTDPIFNIIEFESSIAEDWTAVTPDPELPQP